jgi:hypothetical protein
MIRILLGAVVGGILMFGVGAAAHTGFNAESRHFKRMKAEGDTGDFIRRQALSEGMYGFPMPVEGFDSLPKAEYEAEYNRVNERYKLGPSGYLIVAPRGEDMMGVIQLGGEFIANLVAALLACLIASNFSSASRFVSRWFLLALLGPIGWLTHSLSQGLWYRFPMPFLLDGLWVSMAEWAVAGIAITLIVRPLAGEQQAKS